MTGINVRTLLIFLGFTTVSASPGFAFEPETPTWYKISTQDGTALGYAERQINVTPDGTLTTETRKIFGSRESGKRNVSTTQSTVLRNPVGDTVRLTLQSGRGRTKTMITVGIKNSIANIHRKTRYGEKTYALPLPEDIRFDFGEGLIPEWDFDTTPILEFSNFNAAPQTVERIQIERFTTPSDTPRYIRKTFDGDALRAVSYLTMQASTIQSWSFPAFSQTIVKSAATEADAKAPGQSFKLKTNIGIKSPYKISKSALDGTIRYRFKFKDVGPFPIPVTPQQSVFYRGDQVALNICPTCGPDIGLSDAERQTYLTASPWIESDHPKIRKLANRISRKNLTDTDTMDALAKLTRRRIKDVSFVGHYTAAESLARKAGDCTEDAVTLTALARASGIPARVVSGLVYSKERYHGVRNVFVSHSWMQAWVDGAWESYDISMGDYGAGHIALAIGEGDPAMISAGHQLGGLITLESMVSVKSKPKAND